MHGMQKKAWLITYLFKEWFIFFCSYVPKGVSKENQHFLIMDGHGFHITIQALEQAAKIRLGMVTLPTHTSHAL
jgi:hypothetical protein